MSVAAAATVLSACSSSPETQPQLTVVETSSMQEDTEQQTSAPESTSAASGPTVRDVDYDQLQQVSITSFSSGSSGAAFKYVNGGTTGECFVVNGGIACIGTPDSSVPDVELPPFSGRPGAIQISEDGLAYTIIEGAPPAQHELKKGQWIDFGSVKCAKADDEALVCNSDSAAFEIVGEERRIVHDGPVLTVEELIASAAAKPATEYSTGSDVLVRGPIMCGAMEGPRLAEVMEGEITCKEAMEVLDTYDARKQQKGTGNTLAVMFDSWECSSPTAVRSEELKAKSVCTDRERGITVHDPSVG